MNIKELPDKELFTPGHTACPGCAAPIVMRHVMKIFGEKSVVYNPACCLLVFGGTYPWIAWEVPYNHVAFENTGACITGISRALKNIGRDDVTVLGIAGDGGTADIGFQALSGAAERNEDVVYIMYDNEAYMNTGIQRSGSTPYGAWTTTTPAGSKIKGKERFKKDMATIMLAHNVPYVATLNIAYPADFLRKLEKAKEMSGFRFLQIYAPCPTGWRADPNSAVDLSKLAVETGMWTLWEAENGKVTINKKPKFTPVKEYLDQQGRFRHFDDEQYGIIEQWVKDKWDKDEKMLTALGGD